MKTAALIRPHQLLSPHPSIAEADTIFLVEEDCFLARFRFCKKKLLFHRATMQYYRDYLGERGHQVRYLENRNGSTLDELFSTTRAFLQELHGPPG